MEINLGAQRLNTELVEADAAEGDSLRRTLASMSAEKEAIEQQLRIMSTLDELKDLGDVAVPASTSDKDQVCITKPVQTALHKTSTGDDHAVSA